MWCAVCRLDFIVASEVRHPVGRVCSEDLDFTVHAVAAALIAGERILPCPRACHVCLCHDDGADAAMLRAMCRLHPCWALSPVGNLSSCYRAWAGHTADAEAAGALIRRLAAGCPVRAELQAPAQRMAAASRHEPLTSDGCTVRHTPEHGHDGHGRADAGTMLRCCRQARATDSCCPAPERRHQFADVCISISRRTSADSAGQ